jgi:FkbM family methyltransferase
VRNLGAAPRAGKYPPVPVKALTWRGDTDEPLPMRFLAAAKFQSKESHMFSELPGSAQDFYNSMLSQSIAALKLNTFLDNFDAARFNYDGVDRSKEFNPAPNAFFFDWFIRNYENLYSAYLLLNNESSKRLYLHLIAFRLAGHFSVRLPVDFADKAKEFERFEATAKFTPSQLSANGMFGKLKHFDFEYKNDRYLVDCMGLEYYLVRGQYFYHKDGVGIAPAPGDFVIDGGACTGDTAAVFSNAVGSKGTVFSFDPVANHLAILEHNARQCPLGNVRIMPYGLSDKNILAEPIVLDTYAPGFSSGSHPVPLRSIDYLVSTGEIDKIDFIKLDVEGAELESLRGARESIVRFKPKLAVSLYHKPNDLFELILYIKDKFPFYSCYVNHYSIHMEETVLYCRA